MLPYAHHFVASNNLAIDLRLYNSNLQYEISNIISKLVSNTIPKNWFNTTKRRLIKAPPPPKNLFLLWIIRS